MALFSVGASTVIERVPVASAVSPLHASFPRHPVGFPSTLRVAVVHHWFVTRGGGERVAECIAALFPDAEIFTLLASPEGLPGSLAGRPLHTSFLQKIPFASRFHRHMMPLFPEATESLDLRGFDLVLTSDSGPVKGVQLDEGTIQICFCHSPMRYLWDGYEAYRADMDGITRALFTAAAGRLRRWDVRAAARVTHFVANSNFVAGRIRRIYGRCSTVIHPPIDLHRAVIQLPAGVGTHYLAAGRLVGYKRTDLMIEACRRLGRSLRIVGTGPELDRLHRLADPAVSFLGELPTADLWHEYSVCRALLFAAEEDFGMVSLEAQACGRPVIAFGAGGSLETVRAALPASLSPSLPASQAPPPTGVFFAGQTVESMIEGILRFEAMEAAGIFDPGSTSLWAETFATPVFLRCLRDFILKTVPAAASAMLPPQDLDAVARSL